MMIISSLVAPGPGRVAVHRALRSGGGPGGLFVADALLQASESARRVGVPPREGRAQPLDGLVAEIACARGLATALAPSGGGGWFRCGGGRQRRLRSALPTSGGGGSSTGRLRGIVVEGAAVPKHVVVRHLVRHDGVVEGEIHKCVSGICVRVVVVVRRRSCVVTTARSLLLSGGVARRGAGPIDGLPGARGGVVGGGYPRPGARLGPAIARKLEGGVPALGEALNGLQARSGGGGAPLPEFACTPVSPSPTCCARNNGHLAVGTDQCVPKRRKLDRRSLHARARTPLAETVPRGGS